MTPMDELKDLKIVHVIYSLKDARTGRVLKHPQQQPEEFLIGQGLMLDDFEAHLVKLNDGDNFNFVVETERAYGSIDPHAIFDMPLSTFAEEDGHIDPEVVQVGHVFPMADHDGNRHYGKIIRKMADSVTLDFNHPLAGKDLLFEGEILMMRNANADDVQRFNQ